MPIKLTTFVVLPILILSSLVVASDNPFAEWDRLAKSRTSKSSDTADVTIARPGAQPSTSAVATQPVARKSAGSLSYFSPSTASADRTFVPGKDEGQQRTNGEGAAIVERLRIRPNVQQAAASGNPAAQVKTAQFTPQPKERRIQQTAAQFEVPEFEPFDAEPESNPFEEFLRKQEESRADTVQEPAEPELPEPAFVLQAGEDAEENPSFEAAAETAEAFESLDAPPIPDFIDVGNSQPEAVEEPTVAIPDAAEVFAQELPRGPQAPSVTIRWEHEDSFNVGQECHCVMIVENSGNSAVRNVVAEAVLPEGLELLKSVPAPLATAESGTWTFGELKPGAIRRVELSFIPREIGDASLSAFVRFTGATSSRITVQQPLLALNLTGPDSIEVGQLVNYTIEVSNPGTGLANNVTIQAVIPEGLEHRRGKMLTIEIGTLNAGESRRARLSLTGLSGGDKQLAVRVIGDGGLAEQTLQTVSVAEPKLNIAVRGPSKPVAKESTVFEVVVMNEGRVDSNNVRAKYKIPKGFEFVSTDRGGKFSETERTVDWFVGTLEPSMMKHLTVTLSPMEGGEYRHQVGVISEHGRMTMAGHNCTVQGNAELEVQLTASTQSVHSAGGESSFEINVANTGSSAAEGVGLSCEVPPGLELVNVTGPSEYIADSGVIIFRALPKLEAGEKVTYVVTTTCQRSGQHTARVRVASKSVSQALIDQATITGVAR